MLLNASGCLDALTAPDVARSLDAFVTKTVTPLPREGNAPTRIAETDVGMLNSIGLANPGIDRFVTRNLPQLGKLGVPVWVSVGGFEADEYAEICSRTPDFMKEIETERGRGRATYAEVEESEADLERFRTWFAKVRARDYFDAPGASEAEEAIQRCAAALADFEAEALAADVPEASGGSGALHLLRVVDKP